MLKPIPAGYSSAVFCWLPYDSNSVVQPLDAIGRLMLCFCTAMERPDRETLWGQLSISTQQRVGFRQFMCTQCNTASGFILLIHRFSQTVRPFSIHPQVFKMQSYSIWFVCKLQHWMCVSQFDPINTLLHLRGKFCSLEGALMFFRFGTSCN